MLETMVEIENGVFNLFSKVKQAENFGLTDWGGLTKQTHNTTLSSLLSRPKRSELEKVEREKRMVEENLTNSETQNSQLSVRPDISVERYNELLNQEKKNQSFQSQLKTSHRQIAKQIQQKRELHSELTVAKRNIAGLEKQVDELTFQRDNRPNITLIEHDNLVKQIGGLTMQTSSLRTERDD